MLRLFRQEKNGYANFRLLAIAGDRVLELQHDKELTRTHPAAKVEAIVRGYARYGWVEIDTVDGDTGALLAHLLQRLAPIEKLAPATAPDDVSLAIALRIGPPFHHPEQLAETLDHLVLPPMLLRLLDVTRGVSPCRRQPRVRAWKPGPTTDY